ncbi:hypothetical protein VTN02DRAFT_286 [Thermoascus thermophilus]
MSYLQEAGTPCPGPRSARLDLSHEGRSSSFADLWDHGIDPYEDTAAIDFTTEIRAPLLTGAKPRRAKRTTTFKIHDDNKERLGSTAAEGSRDDAMKRKTIDRKSTMLSQPAQRFLPKVSFAASPSDGASKTRTGPDAKSTKAKTALREKTNSAVQVNKDKNANPKDALKKDVRRNTIYIPDDTAVPSVFMGIFSPVKTQTLISTEPAVSGDTQIITLEARIAKKQQERKSLSAAPRRAPLQQSAKVAQETTVQRDIAGKNGGKENIPPGGLLVGCKDKDCEAEPPVFELPAKSKPKAVEAVRPSKVTKAQPINVRSFLHAEKKRSAANPASRASPKNTVLGVKHSAANSATVGSSSRRNHTTVTCVSKKASSRITKRSTSSTLSSRSRRDMAPSKLTIPNIPKVNIDKKFPLLTEDIPNPVMYEDNWLAHQEIAITQLVNALFDSAGGSLDFRDPDSLRHDLLEIYQDESFILLHKRLQASLLYGALSIPKDTLARGNRLQDDLGFKRTFLDFWTQTYDLSALRAAAETVVGRRISVSSRFAGSANDGSLDQTSRQEKILKKTVEEFLEAFLLKNEDKDQSVAALEAGETNAGGWGYRRSLLRSILMIVLLDKGRLSPDSLLPRRLFVPSSRYKSSAAALQALGHMLLPSIGDINRPLSHLDCHVSYKQHPLQEYEYRIKNLAVDLRDGVLLTRLVELLLYPCASNLLSRQHDPEASATVTMPTGEALNPLHGENDWPLSQHLKLPCVGRATKLFNVQIALSALLGVKGVGVIAQDVRAEDIVDGYREKTLALLWGLVGKWGLGGLVDWDDVRKEIIRLKRKVASQFGEDHSDEVSENEEDFDDGYERHAFLLKQWASILAQLKGLHLDNLTTSFADGKIFGSIVDEYEEYIIGKKRRTSSSVGGEEAAAGHGLSSSKVSLEFRLRALGCSSQFASLVSPVNTASSRIFDRDFTLASLAFLCSRLLSASKRTRAALVLQSAWRRVLARRTLRLRVLAKQVASQCAAVVQTRDRILWAKEVIVNWWRRQKERRKKRAGRVRKGPVKTQSQPVKTTVTSKPSIQNTTARVGARRQPLGNPSGNALEKPKRALPTRVVFQEKVDQIDHDHAERDLWLSL